MLEIKQTYTNILVRVYTVVKKKICKNAANSYTLNKEYIAYF